MLSAKVGNVEERILKHLRTVHPYATDDAV